MDKYLVLENGNVYKGKAFGAEGDATGELVFTTGMVGYTETLTDPSYYGQIIMHTFPEIGNYGIMYDDMESDGVAAAGYVVGNYCLTPSNFRKDIDLDAFMKEKGVIGLYGIDTRALTAAIRSAGVMNAAIVSDPEKVDFGKLRSFKIQNAVPSVSSKVEEIYEPETAKFTVALYDYGAKKNIIRTLLAHNCRVISVPSDTPVQRIKDIAPDGIMLSNGPGNPAECKKEISLIADLMGYKPIFGICLGHQLAALAAGAKTIKLKYGHRGANQPVKELATGRTFITSQNHGYAVDIDSLKNGKVSYINANDLTLEGIDYDEINMVTVQFHPEACAGPRDMRRLFDDFDNMMKGGKR